MELIEKLTLLIPPPRFHTLRFHGVLAPHAAWRSAVIPGRSEAEEDGPPAAVGSPRESASRWAALLRRVFAIDVFACPRCGGRRRLVGGPSSRRLAALLSAVEGHRPSLALPEALDLACFMHERTRLGPRQPTMGRRDSFSERRDDFGAPARQDLRGGRVDALVAPPKEPATVRPVPGSGGNQILAGSSGSRADRPRELPPCREPRAGRGQV